MKSDLDEQIIKTYLDTCDDENRTASMIEKLPFRIIENNIWNEKLFDLNINSFSKLIDSNKIPQIQDSNYNYFLDYYFQFNCNEIYKILNNDIQTFKKSDTSKKLAMIFFRYAYYLGKRDMNFLESWLKGQ